jgi:hypothetical protein
MKNKVYSLQNNVAIFDYYSLTKEKPIFLQAQNIPFLFYPNGVPCFEANAYMLHLFKQNLSTLHGGSLLTYATLISHFIKFYYALNHKCLLTNLTNNHFTNFIHSLSSDERSSNQIRRIGKQTIEFLIFISNLYSKPSLIGVGNNFQIKLILSKKANRKKNPYKDKSTHSYTHLSFPTTQLSNPQSPISLTNINKLREQIRKNMNYGCVLRNLCILDLFQITGARRSEAIFLTVEDVYDALNSNDSVPLLTLRTLKRRDSITYRKIPVPKNFLLNISRYIRNIRNKIIRNKNIKDHGFVFISHTTGKKISSDTLTTYLNNWSRDAEISPPAHAHQFRHRFITEKFKSLIKEHNKNNSDEFRKNLISDEVLKQEVLQWTGHSQIDSLSPYLHLAVIELAGITNACISSTASMNAEYDEMQLYEIIEDYKLGKIDKCELETFLKNFKIIIGNPP